MMFEKKKDPNHRGSPGMSDGGEVAEEKAEVGGVCENCGGPLNEHGLSPYLAEAEQLEPVERDDETDQHAAGAASRAFADAISRRKGA